LIYEEFNTEKTKEIDTDENLQLKYNNKKAVSRLLIRQENNGIKCYKLRKDATVKEVAAALDKSEKSLLYCNDMFEDRTLKSGTFVYTSKKAKKVSRGRYNHVVKEGDSMHTIAQKYGITLKSLYKLNGITYGASAVEGQTLFLK
jgi:LysM repeat protein